jgi:glycerophosphoryl diester phosphodiesterase
MATESTGERTRVRVIAHRGVHNTGATENTMRAFELAAAGTADMVELDVRRSGTGELAILHDHALDGVTLASCSLDEFERRTGFRPPLLADVLNWASDRIGLDVELKEDGYVEQVAALLTEFSSGGGELLVTSFIDPVLSRISELAPSLKLGLLLAFTSERAVARTRACGATVVLPEVRLLRGTLISEVGEAGLELIVWGFTPDDHSMLLGDDRVAGVITDDVAGTLAAQNPRI